MKKNMDNIVLLLMIGSAWGLSEVVLGGYFYSAKIAHASVILGAVAILFLAMGRRLVNLAGSSIVIAGVAALFKLVNASPFYCHLLGIFMTGVAFEAGALVFLRYREDLKAVVATGLLAAYLGNVLFVLFSAFVFSSPYWTVSGKAVSHVLVEGSALAALSVVVMPFAFGLMLQWRKMPARTARTVAVLSTLAVWLIGRI